MSLLELIRSTASTTVHGPSKTAGLGFDLDVAIKVAEDDEEGNEQGGMPYSGDGQGGNDENGNIPGLGENVEEPNEGVELPPELQQLLMLLMQHPEVIQMLMQGGEIPPDMLGQAMGGGPEGMPGGMPPGMGGGGAMGGGGMGGGAQQGGGMPPEMAGAMG